MRPSPGEVLHFSEDPTITRFSPVDRYVWAVGNDRCPDYWFPRQCPRAMAWLGPQTSQHDAERLLGPGTTRVHVIEYGWLRRLQSVALYAYRLPAAPFRSIGHAMVTTETVEPLGPPRPVGDLLALHETAGIQLRLVANVWPWWHLVIESSLEFSGIRLRNAIAAPAPATRHEHAADGSAKAQPG